MPAAVRALRGATTFDVDDTAHVSRTGGRRSCRRCSDRNDIDHDDIISILFTATEDLTSVFPATAARAIGLGDVPLICARELSIDGSHAAVHPGDDAHHSERPRDELRHVYLEGARTLRDDLPE